MQPDEFNRLKGSSSQMRIQESPGKEAIQQKPIKKPRLQTARPHASRGLPLAEAHNYISQNQNNFYNSKKSFTQGCGGESPEPAESSLY